MERDPVALLFCPPQPPVRLPTDRPLVIGRHRDCDFVLQRANVSRRHAEVRPEDGGYVLRDLDSTNGTFVNGRPIEGPHRLGPGDRIEISSCSVLFCRIQGGVDAVDAEPGDEKTVLFERPPSREAFHGDLAEIPPFALLQVLEMGSKTGCLVIDGEAVAGRVWLTHGAPVHAETEKDAGLEAALRLVAEQGGRFRFEPGAPSPEHTMQASVTELLLEASRLQDEADRDDDPSDPFSADL